MFVGIMIKVLVVRSAMNGRDYGVVGIMMDGGENYDGVTYGGGIMME